MNNRIVKQNNEYLTNTQSTENKSPKNIYELIELNVKFSEITAKLRDYYISHSILKNVKYGEANNYLSYIMTLHPEIEQFYYELEWMDNIYDTINNPFFEIGEVKKYIKQLKKHQNFAHILYQNININKT